MVDRPGTGGPASPGSDGPGGPAPVDRRAAFAAGPGKAPPKAIAIFVGAVAVLGLGGVALDRAFPGPVGAAGASTATTLPTLLPPLPTTAPGRPPPAVPSGAALGAPVSAMMGLEVLKPAPATGFTLTDQAGRAAALAQFEGRVVVLSFFDARCDDICPVLETELAAAQRDLAGARSRVAMLTVNTDPVATSPSAARLAVAGAAHAGLRGWEFLTGPVRALNRVWQSYGISIEVQRRTGRVSHNDALYMVGPGGELRLRATPFANEAGNGRFHLPAAVMAKWAAGIAAQARALLGIPGQ